MEKTNLEIKGIKLNWWAEAQIKLRIKEDRKIGFHLEETEFDKVFLQDKEQCIKRMYTFY